MDRFNYYYYLLHIPITVIIDSTVIIPPLFQFQQAIVNFHISTNNDFLMKNPPIWFQAFVTIELLFQLPWFIYYVISGWKTNKKYVGDVVYGLNASLTTLICMIYALNSGEWGLMGVYCPYFFIPLVMMIHGGVCLGKLIDKRKVD